MSESGRIEIGIRGVATQSKVGSIIGIIVGLMLGGFGGLIVWAVYSNSHEAVPALITGIIFGAIALTLIILSSLSFPGIINSNKMMPKPVLEYSEAEDCFYAYNARKHNAEIRIKNGDIIGISGSSFATARGLSIRYRDEKGAAKRVFVGYCRNIDNGALRMRINRYHKPLI